MSNSKLVTYTLLSPNTYGKRSQPITKIAVHQMAGNLTIETCGRIFQPKTRQASSNYGVGTDGRIGMYLEEKNHPWTTSSFWCDARAATIEVANSEIGGQWKVSDKALDATIKLCADICKRNGIKECTYTGGKDGVLQKHEWYSATTCPGPYLGGKFPYIAKEVNKILKGKTPVKPPVDTKELYRVRKSWKDVKSQIGAYSILNNAKKKADKNKGYNVYDNSGKIIHPIKEESSKPTPKHTVESIANDIWKNPNHKWGTGAAREHKITEAGVSYTKVQNLINKLAGISGGGVKKSGRWQFNVNVNIRSAPSTSSPKVGLYRAGQTVDISNTIQKGGYIWGEYKAYSGNVRYVALGVINSTQYGKWI